MTRSNPPSGRDVVAGLLSDPAVQADADLSGRIGRVGQSVPPDSREFIVELSKLLFQESQIGLLRAHELPYPIYDYLQDFAVNEAKPWVPALKRRPVVAGRSWSVLGHQVGMPIGIPASVLTMNHRWIESDAANGFNVLTYKTVRSAERDTLLAPNWVFLEGDPEPFTTAALGQSADLRGDVKTWPLSTDRFSTANSFGVPSKAPSEWQRDVEKSLGLLAADQLLILSVMGTFEDKQDAELVQDFVKVSKLGAATGASAIELNLSCPNGVLNGVPLPPIYRDQTMVQRIVEAVRTAVDPTVSLVLKFGYLAAQDLATTLSPIADIVDGISGINTVQVPVRSVTGSDDAFPGRREAGVSGHVLRDLALDFVSSAAEVRRSSGAMFDIIGMGGVMTPEDARRLYDAGASAVQSASGVFYNPYLASDLVAKYADDFPSLTVADRIDGGGARGAILEALSAGDSLTLGDLVAGIATSPDVVQREVTKLVSEQAVLVSGAKGSTRLYARV